MSEKTFKPNPSRRKPKTLNELIEEEEKQLQPDTGLINFNPTDISTTLRFIDEKRILRHLNDWEKLIDFYHSYPDKLLEAMADPATGFRVLPYQRVGLRSDTRFTQTALTATRGFSKSFVAFASKIVNCVLIPGHKATVIAGTKNQAARIGREKIGELEKLLPGLTLEIDRSKGAGTVKSDDYFRVVFKNGAELDVSSLLESGRGGRRHSILFEEYKDLPKEETNAIALPLLNVPRRGLDGRVNPKEKHHKNNWIGSAGYVGSFAFDKTIETLIGMLIEPDKYFCWGCSYKIPVAFGMLSEDFIESMRDGGTYSESDFSREFLSKWTMSAEGSLFDYERLNKLRKIKRAEWSKKDDPNVFYVCSMDVARHKARSVMMVFKVRKAEEKFLISVVNIIPMEGRNFLHQAQRIKELDQVFEFEEVIIDGNGLGIGLVDFLMMDTPSADSMETYPPWRITNIKDHKNLERDQKIGGLEKLHVLKTNQANAGLIHSTCYSMLFSGRVRLLIDEKTAKETVMATQVAKRLPISERLKRMEPYSMTSLLIAETSNLKVNRVNATFKLEMIRGEAEKDTFSALEYGLHLISLMEKDYYSKRRRRKSSIANFVFKN